MGRLINHSCSGLLSPPLHRICWWPVTALRSAKDSFISCSSNRQIPPPVYFLRSDCSLLFHPDTTRRRVLHITLFVCTFALAIGSEVAQGLLPNDRDFDPWDVLANVVGSLAALGLASAYHKRAVERRRKAKYSTLTGEGIPGEDDLELGESGIVSGSRDQEPDAEQQTGIIPIAPKTVEEELDNWDENAEDETWDEEDDTTGASAAGIKITPASSSADDDDAPKKVASD